MRERNTGNMKKTHDRGELVMVTNQNELVSKREGSETCRQRNLGCLVDYTIIKVPTCKERTEGNEMFFEHGLNED